MRAATSKAVPNNVATLRTLVIDLQARLQSRDDALQVREAEVQAGQQIRHFRCTLVVPMGEEDDCVVAHAAARVLHGDAEPRGHFVASQIVAEALGLGHAHNLPPTPSPSSRILALPTRNETPKPLPPPFAMTDGHGIVKTESPPQCRACRLAPPYFVADTLEVLHQQCNTQAACP